MDAARTEDDPNEKLSDAEVERIAAALERRMVKYIRPEPTAAMPEVSPQQVDLDDFIPPKKGRRSRRQD
jgi:hypothetical protein